MEIKDIEKAPSAEYEGKTYYFCCQGCKEKFLENPVEYLKGKKHECTMHKGAHAEHMKAHESKEHTCCEEHKAHAKDVGMDPVCGMKVKTKEAKHTTEYEGKTYAFCSEGCMKKFKENPEEYMKKIHEDMATCPVSGKKVMKSEAVSMEYEGKTFYFCCEGCKAKFEKDPETYMKKECPHSK
jgi:Cu+-exporting ATPase